MEWIEDLSWPSSLANLKEMNRFDCAWPCVWPWTHVGDLHHFAAFSGRTPACLELKALGGLSLHQGPRNQVQRASCRTAFLSPNVFSCLTEALRICSLCFESPAPLIAQILVLSPFRVASSCAAHSVPTGLLDDSMSFLGRT